MSTLSSPIDFACSHQFPDLHNCGAEAGEDCRDAGGAPLELFHVERLNAVGAQMSDAANPVSQKDFDQAVSNSGLV